MTKIARDSQGRVIQALRLGPTTVTGYTAVSAAAAVANNSNDARTFQLVATTACHIKIGPAPVATINDAFLPAEVILFIEMGPKDDIAFIRNTVDGTAFLTEGI